MLPDLICQRCGICCMTGVCSFGAELENGVCKYLVFDSIVASCQLFIEGKVTKEDIGIGKGCKLRRDPSIFDYYKTKSMEEERSDDAPQWMVNE